MGPGEGGGVAGHREKETAMRSACVTVPASVFRVMIVSLKYLKPIPTGQGFCAM